MRLLFVFIIFVVSLYAQSGSELLKRADKFVLSSSKTDQIRAYNDYKNLYLQALVEDNDALRLNALHGIVKSGGKLNIDVATYKKELQLASSKASHKESKPQKIAVKSQEIKQTKVVQRTQRKPQEIKQAKVAPRKIEVTSSNKLESIKWQENRLILNFDKELTEKQINHFTIHHPQKNQFRYVFDIHSSMLHEAQNLRKNGINRIKIAQYDQDTLRLVIENSQKLQISFKRDGASLIINTGIKSHIKVSHQPEVKQKKVKIIEAPVATKSFKSLDKNKVIVIDPGHGGKDPGAVGYKNYREKVVVLDISKELKAILQARGYRVYLTREGDRFLTLRERTVFANKKSADLFVSIHANAVAKKNAHKAHGVESYFLDKSRSNRAKNVAAKENSADLSGLDFYSKESFLNTLSSHNIIAANKLAIDLQGGMLNTLRKSYRDVKDGGVRPAPFWVLVGAQMPSVLVEVGFLTHPMEAQRLVSKKYQKEVALGLANGIERYFINN